MRHRPGADDHPDASCSAPTTPTSTASHRGLACNPGVGLGLRSRRRTAAQTTIVPARPRVQTIAGADVRVRLERRRVDVRLRRRRCCVGRLPIAVTPPGSLAAATRSRSGDRSARQRRPTPASRSFVALRAAAPAAPPPPPSRRGAGERRAAHDRGTRPRRPARVVRAGPLDGTEPMTYAVRWLRNGKVVASGERYRVARAMSRRQLRCRVRRPTPQAARRRRAPRSGRGPASS